MSEAKPTTTPQGLVANDTRLTQYLHQVRFRRFGYRRVGEMALCHIQGAPSELANDRQAFGVTQREKHVGQLHIRPSRMWEIGDIRGHGSILVEPLRK